MTPRMLAAMPVRLPRCSTKHAEIEAGVRGVYRNRIVGKHVVVYDGIAARLDTDGGRWQTVCETHATICSHETLKTGHEYASIPHEWCEDCAAIRRGITIAEHGDLSLGA